MIERVGGVLRRKFVRDTLTLQIGKVGVLALGILASVVIPVRLGTVNYGLWQLALSLYGIWQTLNITGMLPSAQTRLAEAVGAEDDDALLETLAVFVRVLLIYCTFSTVSLMLAAPLLARLYDAGAIIPTLAVLLTLTQPTELFYHLLMITFSSRRQMRHVAIMQNINQAVLVGTGVVAVWLSPTPYAIMTARLVYSLVTFVMIVTVYQRTLDHATVTYPPLGAVLRRVPGASVADYWRFGVTTALDKNVANLYTQIPVQMAGVLLGTSAAGLVGFALNVMRQQAFFTSAVMDNMQAVVPQAVGREDYARLWSNFSQVLLVLLVGGIGFYGVFALAAPLVVQWLFPPEWAGSVPLLRVLAVFGAVTTVGGVFGPLYRAFDFVRGALVIKVVALVVMVPVGMWLMQSLGAVGSAWMISLLFMLTVSLTAWMTLPELRKRAGA